ncbi:MAG TPA: hypothetical protein VF040_03505 [Ktedonobacterales bacterium]
MTPKDENAHLWDELARQREHIAALMAREHRLETRLRIARWVLLAGVLAVLLTVGAGLLVARSHGAFESRLTYWREHGQNCGSFNYWPNGTLVDRSAAQQAVACFVAAHARCKAAAVTRNVSGTDTGETDTFVVEPWDGGGGCDVGLHSSFGIAGSNRVTTREVQCARVTSANGTLTIGGCSGFDDITMP